MATVASSDTYGEANPRLFAAVFFLAPLITSIIPRLSPAAIALVGASLVLAAFRRGGSWREFFVPSAAFIACLVFSIYVLLNASWAWNQSAGIAKASLLLGAILLVFASATAINKLSERHIHLAAIAFIASAALGGLYLLLQMLTDGAITRFVMNTIPMVRPDNTKRISIVHGEVRRINLNTLNQNVTLLMLHVWPGILMLSAVARPQWRKPMIALFFGTSAAVILLSKHDSSQLALLGSALIFLLARKWYSQTIRGLAVLWCLGFALILPLSFAAYDAGLHLSQSLPLSYKARIIIWEYTSEKTLEHPWVGVGVNSTRERDNAHERETHPSEQPEGFVFKRTTGHHAHSLFLQTWYELGAVGAVLLALAGALVVLRSSRLPKHAQPFAAATFATFAIIAAFAWGAWQTWWLCAGALAAVYLCLGASPFRAAPDPTDLSSTPGTSGRAG